MTPGSYCSSMDDVGSVKEMTLNVIDEANSIKGNVARIVPGQGRAMNEVEKLLRKECVMIRRYCIQCWVCPPLR